MAVALLLEGGGVATTEERLPEDGGARTSRGRPPAVFHRAATRLLEGGGRLLEGAGFL
jgi:hypothetical protein